MWFFRVLFSAVYLTAIVLSIPLAFDVGGKTCGLAYSLSLASFYFFFSVLKLATPNSSRFRRLLVLLVGSTQWLIVPALLIWSLNLFSVDSRIRNGSSSHWVDKYTTNRRRPNDLDSGLWSSFSSWMFGSGGLVEWLAIGSWDKLLRWSSPFFQLAEGFCSLLVIQAAGQITRWLVNRSGGGDTWMISLLVVSASIISSSVYFLWRVLQFPEISNVDAALIGVAITSAVILCAWGIGSGRGNAVESSLLFAYIVLCVYQIFTDYQPSVPVEQAPSASAADFPPLPPIIMASYSTLISLLSLLPSILHAAFNVIVAAFSAVTPSILITLAYRLFVFYASTRIIPAVRESGARALSQEASLDEDDGANKLLGLLSWFSPSILVAVYTSLLMQHFAANSQGATAGGASGAAWWLSQGDVGSNFWRWTNLACTMALYAFELWIGQEDDIDTGLTGHWKTD